mgnify:FL=1
MGNYYCENCGAKDTNIHHLTSGACQKHPNGPLKGNHKLYEGSEKTKYFCKYCGASDPNMHHLTTGLCQKHPKGALKGYHSPAL